MAETGSLGAALTLIITFTGAFIVLLLVLRIAKSRVQRRPKTRSVEGEGSQDRAYNALVGSEAIFEETRGKGIESAQARELLSSAREAYGEGRHEEAEGLAREARGILVELSRGEEPLEPVTIPMEADIPESKPVLGKEYPKNFLQAKFLLRMVKGSIGKGSSPEKKEARKLLKEAGKAFDEERYTEALSITLNAKRALKGEELLAEGGDAGQCPNCQASVTEGDTYCSQCGASLAGGSVCPSCDSQLEAEDRFCRRCGTAVAPLPEAK